MTCRTLSEYFSSVFGRRVWKIPVNAGLGCPNRDGTISRNGCSYCNNAAFNPGYAFHSSKSITEQLAEGMAFCRKKQPDAAYLAYFQSFSNTYGETSRLIGLYEEALAFPGIGGLVIATRPDCLKSDLLDYFESRFGRKAADGHPYLLVEIGVESTNDSTLRAVNRGHDFQCAASAIRELDRRGIAVGAHLILGLPGEDEEDFINHVRRISQLPVTTLKLHHLQIIRGTSMADAYAADASSFHLFSPEEYAALIARLLPELRSDIALDRFVSESPRDMVVAPAWGLKPDEFRRILDISSAACNY